MYNTLHKLFHKVENGYDPVNFEYAKTYGNYEWEKMDYQLIDFLESEIGTFEGKSILDLGGGAGQYSCAFARRGGIVTWHDISRNYMKIVADKAAEAGVRINFSLGYLEDIKKIPVNSFDLVFCRICWYYCVKDAPFVKIIHRIIKPGGVGYINANNALFRRSEASKIHQLVQFLYENFGIKIGHLHPPHGYIAKLLQRYPNEKMILDYTSMTNDRIMFIKRSIPVINKNDT